MDQEIHKRLCKPFFTTRIGGEGIGLGMNLTDNLVVGKLGGAIQCASEPG